MTHPRPTYSFIDGVLPPFLGASSIRRLNLERKHKTWDSYAKQLERRMIGLASDLFTSKNEERFWEVEFSIVDVSEDLERLRSIDLTRHDLWATQLLDELLRRQIVATVEESWPGTYTVNLVGIAMWPFINVCTRQLEADGPSDVLMDLVDKVAAFNQAVSDA